MQRVQEPATQKRLGTFENAAKMTTLMLYLMIWGHFDQFQDQI